MKISEMQDKLQELQNDLSIISETVNAVESSLTEGVLKPGQVGWALIGAVRSLENAVDDTEALINETIQMQAVLEKL